MLQITNTKKESVSRTNVNIVLADSYIANHLELTLAKTQGTETLRKFVFVFVEYEYTVCFFDEQTGKRITATGLVESINGDNNCPGNQYIVLRCKSEKPGKKSKEKTVVSGMPTCGCFLNSSAADKYQTEIYHTIPIRNIYDISYASDKHPNPSGEGCDKNKEVKVVLLGISADVVKAVIVNLKMLMDGDENSMKDVTLKMGNDYNIAYYNNTEKTIYEFDGKLISIRPINKKPPECAPVRISEHVGMSNSIYNSECGCGSTDRDEFMEKEQNQNDIELKFDTSEFNAGSTETILLSWLRDCTLLFDHSIPEPEPAPIDPGDTGCDCDGCEYKKQEVKLTSGTTEVLIDFKNGADGVVCYKNGPTDGVPNGTISLQELVDFYFGG